MNLSLLGLLLVIIGFLVTILFWVPRIVNRRYLREVLGTWYPAVYFIYLANGPVLMLLGLLLLRVASS